MKSIIYLSILISAIPAIMNAYTHKVSNLSHETIGVNIQYQGGGTGFQPNHAKILDPGKREFRRFYMRESFCLSKIIVRVGNDVDIVYKKNFNSPEIGGGKLLIEKKIKGHTCKSIGIKVMPDLTVELKDNPSDEWMMQGPGGAKTIQELPQILRK